MTEDELAAKLLTLARRDLRAAEVLSDQPQVGDGIVGCTGVRFLDSGLSVFMRLQRVQRRSRRGPLLEFGTCDVGSAIVGCIGP